MFQSRYAIVYTLYIYRQIEPLSIKPNAMQCSLSSFPSPSSTIPFLSCRNPPNVIHAHIHYTTYTITSTTTPTSQTHSKEHNPHPSHSSRRLPPTIRNLQPGLNLPPRIHKPPLRLPSITNRIKLNLPRLIKRLEPKVARPILERLTRPVGQKGVHLIDACDGARAARRTRRVQARQIGAVVEGAGHALARERVGAMRCAVGRRPADLGDECLLLAGDGGGRHVVGREVIRCPGRGLRDLDAAEERVHVAHDNIDCLGHGVGRVPITPEIGRREWELDAFARQVLADGVKEIGEAACGQEAGEEDFVADDEACEGVLVVGIDDVPHLGQLAVVGGLVLLEVDAEPDFHAVFHVELVDGVEHHFRLVAVVAVEPDLRG